jgi:LysR family hydrogen peroxide-inducible transcriptional activator
MEMHQLRYFLAVADTQGITRASRECAVSQPSLSLAIKKLEEELGGALFERGRKAVRLTERGRLFLPRARAVVEALLHAREEMAEVSGLARGRVTLGCLPTTGAYLLPAVLKAFRGLHPGIVVQLKEESSPRLAELLEQGEADLGILDEAGLRPTLKGEKLFSDPLLLALPPGHALARRRKVSLKQMAGEDVILMKQGHGYRQITLRAFEQAGITPKVVFESGEIQVVQALVAAGLGISLVPRMVARQAEGQPAYVALQAPAPSRTLYLASRRRAVLSPAAQALRQACLSALRKETQ